MSQCDCERCKPPIEPCNCPQSLALIKAITRIWDLSAPGRGDHNGTDMRAIHRIATDNANEPTGMVVMRVDELIETAERGEKLIDALRRIVAVCGPRDGATYSSGDRDAVVDVLQVSQIAREALK